MWELFVFVYLFSDKEWNERNNYDNVSKEEI